MVDAALIQHCADAGLTPAIVERFIAEAGSTHPLAVTVTSGNRVLLVPKPTTAGEAMALMRDHVGKAVVRVGITQYPAGLGVAEASQLDPDLVDPCANIRMGTALFAKVYRIVTAWYRAEPEEAIEDAILAWRSGYFEGQAVFAAPEPGVTTPATATDEPPDVKAERKATEPVPEPEPEPSRGSANDPFAAGIRVDLSGIGGGKPW